MNDPRDLVTAAFETNYEWPSNEKDTALLQALYDEPYSCIRAGASLASAVMKTSLVNRLTTLGMTDLPHSQFPLDGAMKFMDAMYEGSNGMEKALTGAMTGKKSVRMYLPVFLTNELGPMFPTMSRFNFQATQKDGSVFYSATNGMTSLYALLDLFGWKTPSTVVFNGDRIKEVSDLVYDSTEVGEPMADWLEREIFDTLVNGIKGIEFTLVIPSYDEDVAEKNPSWKEHNLKGYMIDRCRDGCSLIVRMLLDFPLSVGQYLTQDEEVPPHLLQRWCQQFMAYSWDGPEPGPMRDLNAIVEETSEALHPIKVSNEDNLTVLFDGTPMYVPDLTDLDTYNDYEKTFVDRTFETKEGQRFDLVPSVSSGDAAALKLPTNRFLYTDWRFARAVYVNTVGNLNLLDLGGAIPMPHSAQVEMLSRPLSDEVVSATLASLDVMAKKAGLTFWKFVKPEDMDILIPISLRDQYHQLASSGDILAALNSLRIGHLAWGTQKDTGPLTLILNCRRAANRITGLQDATQMYGDFDYESITGEEGTLRSLFDWPFAAGIVRCMQAIHEKLDGDYSALFASEGVLRIMKLAPIMSIVARCPAPADWIAKERAERQKYVAPDIDENYTPLPVPNLKDDMAFLPHQVKADATMSQEYDNEIAAVAPGGGKTLLEIINAMRDMGKKRRSGVICPNYLMKNYIEDAIFASHGKVNVFPIDNSIFNRYGEKRLREMIELSPPNTLFVIGLSGFSRGQNIEYFYCGQNIVINQYVEFLRSIEWDCVSIDESHLLANPDSKRTASVARVLSGVKHQKRLMTGTFINGTMLDAFGQAKMLDPSLFGTYDAFTKQYGQAFAGSRVTLWKPQAEAHIRMKLRTRNNLINIRRKEWAALLPNREESFHWVDLTENQRRAYQAILEEVLKEIKEDKNLMAKLKDGAEADADNLEQYLRRYLARIERFLASCDLDELGKRVLSGADLISPKIDKVNEILAKHFADPAYKGGKVLIFTSYRDSAESIFKNLAPQFREKALHYVAEDKAKLIPRMKRDKTVQIVVGVENSLNTGHNFQAFNRIIRIESVWNPGTLDQAESRVFRPNVKEKETRSKIALDWICANKTIDITKTARLISKIVSAVKFNEMDNPLYHGIPDLEVVSMTFESIKASNDFNADLMPYLEAYESYKQAETADFEEFRKRTKHKEPVAVPSSGVMDGSRLMRVPYIADMVLPFQEELGLKNIADVALDLHLPLDELDDQIIGERVHTELGDGVISGATRSSVRVKMDGGGTSSFQKTAVFIITKKLKGTVWDNLKANINLEEADMTVIEEQEDEQVEQQQVDDRKKRPKEPVPNLDTTANASIEVFLGTHNDMVCVSAGKDDPDLTPVLAKKLGLRDSGPFYWCHIRNYRIMEEMLDTLESKFDIAPKTMSKLRDLQAAFTQGRTKLLDVEAAQQADIRNFYRLRPRRIEKGALIVYPMIEDGDLYLVAWADTQPSARQLPRLKVKGTAWELYEGFYGAWFAKKTEAKAFIQEMTQQVTISNMDEVKEQYNDLRIVRKRSTTKK